MHDLFSISAKHNRIQSFILGHLYSARESEGNTGAKLVAFYIFSLFYTKRNIEYNW
jgi:hypothetical protein